MNGSLLLVGEVASRLRVSKQTVYRLINDGVLPATRVGRQWRVPEQSVHHLPGGTHTPTTPPPAPPTVACTWCGTAVQSLLVADGWARHPGCGPDTPLQTVASL
jgi:excisionase family DNA binding protein